MKSKPNHKETYRREPVQAMTVEAGILEAELRDAETKLANTKADLLTAQQQLTATEVARQRWQQEALRYRGKLVPWKVLSLLLLLGLVASLILR